MKYQHKDVWTRRGEAFTVEVSRHALEYPEGPKHTWCVYVYLYGKHPQFASVSAGGDLEGFDLHGGETYRHVFRADDGSPKAVQVGCDYNHLYDYRFNGMATASDAQEVFSDADALYEWASRKGGAS